MQARVEFAALIPWTLRNGRPPTPSTPHSLISFTGLQGIAPWLSRQPVVRDLGLDLIPNQFFREICTPQSRRRTAKGHESFSSAEWVWC